MAELIHNPEIKALIHPTIINNPSGEYHDNNYNIINNQDQNFKIDNNAIMIQSLSLHKLGGPIEIERLSIRVMPYSESLYSTRIPYEEARIIYIWYPSGEKLAELYYVRDNTEYQDINHDNVLLNKAYIFNQDGTPFIDANLETNQYYKFVPDAVQFEMIDHKTAESFINGIIRSENPNVYDYFIELLVQPMH